MKPIVVLAVLVLAGSSHAVDKCYRCKAANAIAELTAEVTNELAGASECPNAIFEKKEDERTDAEKAQLTALEKNCPAALKTSCIKVKKGDDIIRSCSDIDDDDKCLKTENKDVEHDCSTCTGELCNAAGHGWPSVAVLLSALAVALLGSR